MCAIFSCKFTRHQGSAQLLRRCLYFYIRNLKSSEFYFTCHYIGTISVLDLLLDHTVEEGLHHVAMYNSSFLCQEDVLEVNHKLKKFLKYSYYDYSSIVLIHTISISAYEIFLS